MGHTAKVWPEGDQWRKYMARCVAGSGANSDADVPGTSSIKYKSMPGASTQRLHARLAVLHQQLHGDDLRDHDDTRRALINAGLKSRAITHELRLRGEQPGECRHCWGLTD